MKQAVMDASVHAGNMMLFGADGLIKRYETPQEILVEFFAVRMKFYQKRHAFLIAVSAFQYDIHDPNC